MSYDLDSPNDLYRSRARCREFGSDRLSSSPFRRNPPKGHDMRSTGEGGFLSGVRVIDRKTFDRDRYHTDGHDDGVPEASVVYQGYVSPCMSLEHVDYKPL